MLQFRPQLFLQSVATPVVLPSSMLHLSPRDRNVGGVLLVIETISISPDKLAATSSIYDNDIKGNSATPDEIPFVRDDNKSPLFSHYRCLIACFISFALIAATFLLITSGPLCILSPSYHSPITYDVRDQEFNLVLFGDSLVSGNHYQKDKPFSLIETKTKAFIPNYNLILKNRGHGGDGISALRDRILDASTTHADAIIIVWDSDVSSNEETSENRDRLLQSYISDVTYVIKFLQQNSSASFLALAGPVLLGEGPLLTASDKPLYYTKISMLDEYSEVNRKIATETNIKYIDLRSAFLSALPVYRLSYAGCLTQDGEHENENGATIMARHYANTVVEWLAGPQR